MLTSARSLSLRSPAVKKTSFATPQECEAAFYEALERSDFEAMMEVWSEDDEVVCVHPGGPRLTGYDQVRSSWAQMLQAGARLSIQVTSQVQMQGVMMAIHSVFENIAPANDVRRREPVVATNVYSRGATGWRMLVHHASPAPAPVALTGVRETRADAPKTLH
jgi:ketosteroid isomerase-like protein